MSGRMASDFRPPLLPSSHPSVPPRLCRSPSLLLLSLCLALLLTSSAALPIGLNRAAKDTHRRGPQHTPSPSSSSDAQSDLSPNAHRYMPRPSPSLSPLNPLHTTPPTDADSPPLSPTQHFTPGAGAADDPDHSGHGPVDDTPPTRIRSQSQQGGLYAQQKKTKSQHGHDHADDVIVNEPAATAPTSSSSDSSTDSSSCLTAKLLTKAKKEARAKLLSVMDQYLAAWQAEEKTEDEIEKLYEDKKEELKVKLAATKQKLMARACAGEEGSKSANSSSRRRLLGVEEDDWLDQDDDKVYLIDESSSASVEEDSTLLGGDEVGAVAHIVAGGGSRTESEDDDDAPRHQASVYPFSMPSAFTSLSERDIEAIHSPPPPPPPKTQPAAPAAELDNSDMAFVASISPARYSPAPVDPTPVIVVGQRSQRDMDEDLEEERRRRRDRLKLIRSRSSNDSPIEPDRPVPRGSLPLSDDELPPGGFIASISPMAPQHTTPDHHDEEGAHAYVGSISAPVLNGGAAAAAAAANSQQRSSMSLQERWRREEAEERETEEGGGVWRSGSRGRLERTVGGRSIRQ